MPSRVDVSQKPDQTVKVRFLIVVHRHVAAIWTEEKAAIWEELRHLLHPGWFHRVVTAGDDERRNVDLRKIGCAIPVQQFATRAQLTRSLHRDVDF